MAVTAQVAGAHHTRAAAIVWPAAIPRVFPVRTARTAGHPVPSPPDERGPVVACPKSTYAGVSMGLAGEFATVVAAAVTVLAVLGGYVQFVLKRSLLPCVEFDVDFALLRRGEAQAVGDVSCVVRNVGTNMAVVSNVRFRCRYRLAADAEDVYPANGTQPRFAHSLSPGGYLLVGEGTRTFVQPGVTQRYRTPVALPATVQIVDVLAAFDYKIDLGRPSRLLIQLFARPSKRLELDWRKGITNHRVRRTFATAQERDS